MTFDEFNDIGFAHIKAKPTALGVSRNKARAALAEVRDEMKGRGQHDRAALVGIALDTLPDEALNAIIKAVADA